MTLCWKTEANERRRNSVVSTLLSKQRETFGSYNYSTAWILINHLKAKAVPLTPHRGAWGKRSCSSYSFSTSVLDGGGWSASHPGRALASGKVPPVPIVQEAGWTSELVWTDGLEE
jgi:hypothetical protein